MLKVKSSLDDATEDIVRECIGCGVAVHRVTGPGYSESIYERAMCVEMLARGLPFEKQRVVEVRYRGVLVGVQRLDLVVGGAVVLELKAVERIERVHVSQLVSYLHAARLRVGLIINFRVPVLTQGLRRVVV